jgi:hypothetical protein
VLPDIRGWQNDRNSHRRETKGEAEPEWLPSKTREKEKPSNWRTTPPVYDAFVMMFSYPLARKAVDEG